MDRRRESGFGRGSVGELDGLLRERTSRRLPIYPDNGSTAFMAVVRHGQRILFSAQ